MGQPEDRLDDEDYPAYTMGRAAEIISAARLNSCAGSAKRS